MVKIWQFIGKFLAKKRSEDGISVGWTWQWPGEKKQVEASERAWNERARQEAEKDPANLIDESQAPRKKD